MTAEEMHPYCDTHCTHTHTHTHCTHTHTLYTHTHMPMPHGSHSGPLSPVKQRHFLFPVVELQHISFTGRHGGREGEGAREREREIERERETERETERG